MCIIYPMKNSIGSYPTKMFEYMAIGLPQVISDFPLYKSVVETHNCGICVDPMQPTEIANAIEKLLVDSTLSEKMQQNSIVHANKYTWDSQFAKVEVVYSKLTA